ncbi:CoA pyrophosphatase [Geotalea sp. SG265]|uniref:NUDIX hydrolase n=1 Tax=Geotalea sp. SG265 TaxID=2922867 RepID=UPI001FAEC5A2|nr:CoA pyrophosphatase [Geotalea sp. SG265]
MKIQAISSRPERHHGLGADGMDPFQQIQHVLGRHRPRTVKPDDRAHAAVAMILRERLDGLSVLLIQRSLNEKDFWSGQIGLPGGRTESADNGPMDTAERETREELGLDLSDARYLGRLKDLAPKGLNIVVSCFVYALRDEPVLHPDPLEVAEAFWFPLRDLDNPAGRARIRFLFKGRMRSYPAVSIPGPQERQLWGITYDLLQQIKKAIIPTDY